LALPLIQDGNYGCHLGFGFRRLEDKRLGRFIQNVLVDAQLSTQYFQLNIFNHSLALQDTASHLPHERSAFQ
jgi:hypothetical protein